MQQCNLQMEGHNNGGSELPSSSSSDGGQSVVSLKEMIKKEVEVVVIRTVQQVIGRVMEDLVRKTVKEEIQLAVEKLLAGGTRNYPNEMTALKERSLQLKFLNEVCGPVLTGKPIKAKGDTPLRVALVDETTKQIVSCWPESSAKVEMLVLDASGNDNEHNLSLEDFNNTIIKEGDKDKPHFAKSSFIYLKEGVGIICNAKLGHGSDWTKSCKCRLGARIVENLRGVQVQEAWTESFMVLDSRSKLYEKHYPPSLSDQVWRLENISRDGSPRKRLNNKKISTVQEFLFWLSIYPLGLRKIVGAGPRMWKAIVDHAQTCVIDDKRMNLYYPNSSAFNMGVVFDVVGRLKGAIRDSQYVPINNLSAEEKDSAHKLLLSAFESWFPLSVLESLGDITSFDDETSLLCQFPHRSSDINAATNPSIPHGCAPTISKNNNVYIPTVPVGTSSQHTEASDPPNDTCHFNSIGSTSMGQPYDVPYLRVPYKTPSYQYSDLDSLLEPFSENDFLMSLISCETNSFPETLMDESHSRQQYNGKIHLVWAVAAILWMARARKRVLALGGKGIHVQKKQRI